ncbi:MAG TPA: cupredoxin family copper-binding protein [Longimicrobiaceae bacterium]|nr:cupredoxin family copper-binding protein [Longimicrobiaceae bacterium]
MPRIVRAVLAASLAAGVLAPGAAGQSLLDRPPNLSGGWVGNGGQLYFNFLHRFVASDEPERKVSNVPTFTLAAGLGMRTLVGLQYATNSALSPRYPNEWELFARYALLQQERGAPLDLAGQVGYNLAGEGVDGELSLARRMGPLRVIAVGRVLSDAVGAGETRFAVGGGGTLRLTRYIALAGDVATITERVGEEKVAWSAGIHLGIPHSPHTLSLHASNTNAYTLQGLSRGEDIRRYGFEFTVPITLSRYFGRGGGAAAPGAAPGAPPAAPAAPAVQEGGVAATGTVFRAQMQNLAFMPTSIEIQAGTRVEWTNNAPLAHTVSADDASFESGLIEPGRTWSYTFTRPGTYPFHCTPHPFMKGTVVVR